MRARTLAVALAGLFLFIAADNTAHATFVDASVTVNSIRVDTFDISGGAAPTLTWVTVTPIPGGPGGTIITPPSGYVTASAQNGLKESASSTTNPGSASVTQASASASYAFLSSIPTISASGHAGPYSGSPFSTSTYASASAQSRFILSGTGLVVFYVDYTLSVTGGGGTNDSAYGSSLINASMSETLPGGGSTGAYGSDSLSGSQYAMPGLGLISAWTGAGTRTGELRVAGLFDGGQTINFSLSGSTNTSTSSPVPAPSTLLLLGPGLFVLFSLRKRSKE